MGIVKESINIDFEVDPRPLTAAEEKAISEFIRADKERRKGNMRVKRRVAKVSPKKRTP